MLSKYREVIEKIDAEARYYSDNHMPESLATAVPATLIVIARLLVDILDELQNIRVQGE